MSDGREITFEYVSPIPVIRKRRTRVALEVVLPHEDVEEILKRYPRLEGFHATVYLWLKPREIEHSHESYHFDKDFSFEESDDDRTWQSFAE